MTLTPFTSSLLAEVSHCNHGFYSRQGGVSLGYFSSLNCNGGRGDDARHVKENRQRILQHLKGSTWVGLEQKHTAKAIFIDAPLNESVEADAMVTCTPGLALGIITADCVPILLADRKRSIIGAVHSGWRGTFDGIIGHTIALMKEKGARDIVASIGPCIHQESYEVGPEFKTHFFNHPYFPDVFAFDDFFKSSPHTSNHYLFNLPKLVLHELQQHHIFAIDQIPYNTYTDEALFFSYRRKSLRNEPPMGCQASCITIKEPMR